MPTIASPPRIATIVGYNFDGTVRVRLDRQSYTQPAISQEVDASIPLAYSGPNGEFIGGFPVIGTSVLLEKSQGGWSISTYLKSDNIYPNINEFGTSSIDGNLMGELASGKILLQSANATNRIFLHPTIGIEAGSQTESLRIDPNLNIISHNFAQEMSFTESRRFIDGRIKRDNKTNTVRDINCSILYSHEYDNSLWEVGMIPGDSISYLNSGTAVRNLPLAENREIIYEFADSSTLVDFTTDQDEAGFYQSKQNPTQPDVVLKTDSRAYAFGLSLNYPNHLIEEIKGTGVDGLGNVIDLNRYILPIGRDDNLSFYSTGDGNNLNSDNVEVFRKVRALHRKSLAYHFELNARKANGAQDAIYQVPDINSSKDFARDRSRFFIDIDKEGQFKINIPASSETGNLPLLARYETASEILKANGDIDNPNKFVIEDENSQDIYLDSHAINPTIRILKTDGSSADDIMPQDRIKNSPMRYGTAYHDILSSGYQFTKKRLSDDVAPHKLLARYIESSAEVDQGIIRCNINERENSIQYDKIISDSIYVSGPKVGDVEPNAGGRSGMINFDGFINLNIGANTVDRQSMWLDCAGGIVSNIGRDKRGISACHTLDGDLLIQVGGAGLGSSTDSRFSTENDAYRPGAVDIRVLNTTGMTIIRIDEKGASVVTPGRVQIASEQTLELRSKTQILLEAPLVTFYPDGDADGNNSVKRTVKRSGTDI